MLSLMGVFSPSPGILRGSQRKKGPIMAGKFEGEVAVVTGFNRQGPGQHKALCSRKARVWRGERDDAFGTNETHREVFDLFRDSSMAAALPAPPGLREPFQRSQ